MKYKAVFVDWNGTLSSSRFWTRWADKPDTQEWYALVQGALFDNIEGRLIIGDWMRGLRSVDNVMQYIHDVTSIPIIELENELRYSSEHMTIDDPSIIERLKILRDNGIKVVIATDNMDVFRRWTIDALQLEDIFDGILVSDTQGALKKEVDSNGMSPFFHLYLTQNQLKAGESVLVDDSEDSRIVESFGIDFLHVNESKTLVNQLDYIITKLGLTHRTLF